MIEVAGLTKQYDRLTAVDDLSFNVRAGEIMGLVGPNGAGKTTTLRCATGIIPMTSGSVQLCGIDLAADPIEAKRKVAFIADEPRLFEYLTVWQHLNFVARLYGVADYEARGKAILAELDMADKTQLLPAELSRGMKQKLAIACGLLHGPRIVIFDEPLTGLDPAGIRRMKEVMRRLASEGAAIILSSHLISLLEAVCSHLLILKDGVKVADGSVAQIQARYGDGSDAQPGGHFLPCHGRRWRGGCGRPAPRAAPRRPSTPHEPGRRGVARLRVPAGDVGPQSRHASAQAAAPAQVPVWCDRGCRLLLFFLLPPRGHGRMARRTRDDGTGLDPAARGHAGGDRAGRIAAAGDRGGCLGGADPTRGAGIQRGRGRLPVSGAADASHADPLQVVARATGHPVFSLALHAGLAPRQHVRRQSAVACRRMVAVAVDDAPALHWRIRSGAITCSSWACTYGCGARWCWAAYLRCWLRRWHG